MKPMLFMTAWWNQHEVSFTDNPQKRRVSWTFGEVVSRQSNDCAWHPATNSIAPHNREIKGSKRSDWGGVSRGRRGAARHRVTTVAEGMIQMMTIPETTVVTTSINRLVIVYCTKILLWYKLLKPIILIGERILILFSLKHELLWI